VSLLTAATLQAASPAPARADTEEMDSTALVNETKFTAGLANIYCVYCAPSMLKMHAPCCCVAALPMQDFKN